jgi:hypothetical protein
MREGSHDATTRSTRSSSASSSTRTHSSERAACSTSSAAAGLYDGIAKRAQEVTVEVSDHLPLWIETNTGDDRHQLEQIVTRSPRSELGRRDVRGVPAHFLTLGVTVSLRHP